MIEECPRETELCALTYICKNGLTDIKLLTCSFELSMINFQRFFGQQNGEIILVKLANLGKIAHTIIYLVFVPHKLWQMSKKTRVQVI